MDPLALLLVLVLVVASSAWALVWLSRESRSGEVAEKDAALAEAERQIGDQKAALEYEAAKDRIAKETEARRGEVDRNGPDPDRLNRLLRGWSGEGTPT